MRGAAENEDGHAALWLVELIVPDHTVTIFQNALEPFASAVTAFEVPGSRAWRLAAYMEGEPDRGALDAALTVAALGTAVGVPPVQVAPLPETDWLAENRRAFPPIRAGRWYIHGTHDATPPPAGALVLCLDAGAAFGSGTHETTRGCLIALDRLVRRRRYRRPLDLGCGSGILALALARLWHGPVAASDVDPVAVATARENARLNGLAQQIRATVAEGVPRRSGRHDLIVANILARPLIALAPSVARALEPEGTLVLSGILRHQEAGVVAAYRARGLALVGRVPLGDWPTLVFRRVGGHTGRQSGV